MKNLILFDDDDAWQDLLPLTYTKPISELRVGILSIREKWEQIIDSKASYITQDFLAEKYPISIGDDNLLINSTYLPTPEMVLLISDLALNEAILCQDQLIAARLDSKQFDKLIKDNEIEEIQGYTLPENDVSIKQIKRPYHLFSLNGSEIKLDFKRLTKGRSSAPISQSNTTLGSYPIFIEEGASIEAACLNSTEGPIYIGKNATIMEGSLIRGPFAMNDNTVVKMGARIYKDTTLGPFTKAGGEISNVVFQGYCSKAHDGYLGNSVIGEWCNIGAGTEVSNLKNNYDEVKVWHYPSQRFEKTGLTFHGLIMGDHSKCGINSMINTGTVIGVSCNVYGDGFPRNFIPSFSWGGNSGFTSYQIKKAFATAEIVMSRRNKELDDVERKILNYIFLNTAKSRTWE